MHRAGGGILIGPKKGRGNVTEETGVLEYNRSARQQFTRDENVRPRDNYKISRARKIYFPEISTTGLSSYIIVSPLDSHRF